MDARIRSMGAMEDELDDDHDDSDDDDDEEGGEGGEEDYEIPLEEGDARMAEGSSNWEEEIYGMAVWGEEELGDVLD